MADRVPDQSGAASEQPLSDKAWLDHMLSRSEPDERGSTRPNWATNGRVSPDLAGRAEAYIEAGGSLDVDKLSELRRYLGAFHRGFEDGGSVSHDDEAISRHAQRIKIRLFATRVSELLREARRLEL